MAGRSGKPLAAVASQGIVAGSSLLLQLVALWKIGERGLGQFALLFGILVTINSIQSGWLGDSLTVLDRFEPGIRRALVRSQLAVVILVFGAATLLALPVGDVGLTTAVLFGVTSTAWAIEETFRRLLIARREFTKLVVNDAAFAAGSFGLVGFVVVTGATFELETLVLALLAGAAVAIAVGVIQLPAIELSRGILGPSQMRTVASFAVWRAAQVGLRPGSQTIVRFLVVWVASEAALGQLEAARLVLAPVLTVVNGAGVYLLPTYSAQARDRRPLRPSVPFAMLVVAALAGGYGALAVAFRGPLTDLLTDGTTAVTLTALVAWTAYSIGFGAGVPAGNALVARGRSRDAFTVRIVDAVVGVAASAVIAVAIGSDAVPFGLALGTFVGAILLLRGLRDADSPGASLPAPDASQRVTDLPAPTSGATPSAMRRAGVDTGPVDEPLRIGLGVDVDRVDRPADTDPVVFGDISSMRGSDDDTLQWTPPLARLPRPRVARATTRATIGDHSPFGSGGAARRALKPVERDRWLWLLPLVAIVATEYKFRRRPIDEALGGAVDLMIIAELGVYALIGLWAVWRLAPTRPRLTALTVAMWGYILTTAASSLYSTFPLLALARGVQLVIIGAVVHVIATDGRIRHLTKLIHGWIVLLTVSIAVGLAYVAPTTGPQEGRFTWLHVHSVSAGSMLALSTPILLGLWLSARQRDNPIALPWPRWVYGSLLVAHGVFLLATRTRGSIGGCFVALAVMAWIWSGQKAKPQLVLASLVGGGASLLAFGATVLSFLTRGESADQIGTFNRRTEIWSLAWESFLDRPLHGLGFTSAKGVFFDETGLGGAHNAVVNVVSDAG
ncbi:MAG: O-antigen ligase family protein, partial [Ilumatobacter sp.]|uniref:O-antigen ligase family protein n=1 Tax=Ilumatobacter sp. TaxID=1967498 RepID=UPI0032973FA3